MVRGEALGSWGFECFMGGQKHLGAIWKGFCWPVARGSQGAGGRREAKRESSFPTSGTATSKKKVMKAAGQRRREDC